MPRPTSKGCIEFSERQVFGGVSQQDVDGRDKPGHDSYIGRMFRIISALLLAFAIGAAPALAAPAYADTAPPKKKPAVTRQAKPHAKKWTTPPGYRSPAQIERDEFKSWRRERRFAQRTNVPRGYYYYYASPYYYGGRFSSERFGARVGPCWTQTPIGAVWNCGK